MQPTLRSVLCAGGPLDGEWRKVQGDVLEALVPPENPWDMYDRCETVQYRVHRLHMFGRIIHLAVPSGDDLDEAAFKALFKPHVAATLRATDKVGP